jgi:hypothetical protein
MYPREEFITAGVREIAQGGEYPIIKSKDDDASRGNIYKHINMGKDDFIANSYPGLFKNILLCFVFGIKTYFQKWRVQLYSYSFVGRHYKRVSL